MGKEVVFKTAVFWTRGRWLDRYSFVMADNGSLFKSAAVTDCWSTKVYSAIPRYHGTLLSQEILFACNREQQDDMMVYVQLQYILANFTRIAMQKEKLLYRYFTSKQVHNTNATIVKICVELTISSELWNQSDRNGLN